MLRAFSVGSVIAFVCFLFNLLPVQAFANVSSVSTVGLWPMHGAALGTGNCPASAVYPDDGCTGAAPDGNVRFPNFFTATSAGYVSTGGNPGDMLTEANMGLSAVIGSGIARQSPVGPEGGCNGTPCASGGNTSTPYAVTPPFDVAGVTFPVGYSQSAIASQTLFGSTLPGHFRDPALIHSDQTACSYNPSGNPIGGPEVDCFGGTVDIEGYDFGAHGCVRLFIDGNQTPNSTILLKNNRWIVGPGCITPLDGNGSVEGNAITTGKYPGGAYITASMGEAYQGYINGATLCTKNGSVSQGTGPKATPSGEGGWILDNVPDGPNVTTDQGGQGSCAATFHAWTLAWGDVGGSGTNNDRFNDGANQWAGYIINNYTTLCVSAVTAGSIVVGHTFDDQGRNGQVPWSGGTPIGSATITGASTGTCPSSTDTAYPIAVTVGSSSSPVTINQRTEYLYVTSINSGGMIGLGNNGTTQAAQSIQTDNHQVWFNKISIDACPGGAVTPGSDVTTSTGTCNITGQYFAGWSSGGARYFPPQQLVAGGAVPDLIEVGGDKTNVNVDMEQDYIDGYETRYPYVLTCGNDSAMCIYNAATWTMKYSAFVHMAGRNIQTHAQTTDFEDNYMEGLGINGGSVHKEFNINGNPGFQIPWTTQTMIWVNNTLLVPGDTSTGQATGQGGTAPIWAKNPNDDYRGNPKTTAITLVEKYNTIIDNANQWDGFATMGNSGGLYIGGGATYPNPVIKYNYIDATGTASSVCIFSDGQVMNGVFTGSDYQGDPAWLANGTNYSLTTGHQILTWNSNCK